MSEGSMSQQDLSGPQSHNAGNLNQNCVKVIET